MNYIEDVAQALDNILKMTDTPYVGLLGVYALLVFTVGEKCTNENIHDAWSIWQTRTEPEHRSLIPFDELTKEVQDLDTEYRDAVIEVAKLLENGLIK